MLESLVQLYYGDVRVRVTPLEEPPHWDEVQTRVALGPNDALFSYVP